MTMPAQLMIWNDRFVYSAPRHEEASSVRYTATILIALSDARINLGFDDETVETASAILIAPHVSRSLKCGGPFVSINYDPLSYEHFWLVSHLRGRRSMPVSFDNVGLRRRLDRLLAGDMDCSEAACLTADIAAAAVPERPEPHKVDVRILSVAHRIKAELPNAPDVEKLAAFAGISPDWLGHLFSEQMGVSLKSYLVWAKMRRAATLLHTGRAMADIATEAGFADAAHLTRSFKKFFGLQPSYLGDLSRVRTSCCET